MSQWSRGGGEALEPVWRWQWVGRFVSGLHGKLGLLSEAWMVNSK